MKNILQVTKCILTRFRQIIQMHNVPGLSICHSVGSQVLESLLKIVKNNSTVLHIKHNTFSDETEIESYYAEVHVVVPKQRRTAQTVSPLVLRTSRSKFGKLAQII